MKPFLFTCLSLVGLKIVIAVLRAFVEDYPYKKDVSVAEELLGVVAAAAVGFWAFHLLLTLPIE